MSNVAEVKKQFETILSERTDLINCFSDLDNKIGVLKGLFDEIVKTHGHKGYIFGIDSFCFQNRLIETDVSNLKTIFKMIDSRVYCEYYNLYNQVKKYGKEAMRGQKALNNNFEQEYPPYKHLNHKAVYNIETIQEMQLSVTSCLNDLELYLSSKEQEVLSDEQQSICGLNIDNLVYTEMFNNAILKARIDMFYKYLNAFHEHHNKYYSRLLLKVKMQSGIVNEDIRLKQFSQQEKASDLKGMLGIKTGNSPVSHIDDKETATIKSYVNYENMDPKRRAGLDNIIQSAGSDSESSTRSANGTPKVNGKKIDKKNIEVEDDSSIESVEESIEEPQQAPVAAAAAEQEEEDEGVSLEVHDVITDDNVSNGENIEQPDEGIDNSALHIEDEGNEGDADVDDIDNADVDDIDNVDVDSVHEDNNIPEESEIASAVGELSCQFSEEDINKRCMIDGYDTIGTIRFVGVHVHEGVMRIGVELDSPVGKNNGTIRGHKYFECDTSKGILTAPRKVSLIDSETL